MSDFIGFLNRNLDITKTIELFICWEGSQAEAPVRKFTAVPKELLGNPIPYDELDFIVFKKE